MWILTNSVDHFSSPRVKAKDGGSLDLSFTIRGTGFIKKIVRGPLS